MDSSPIENAENVRFLVYEYADLNVSKSALQHEWKLEALASLVVELVQNFPHDIFLCTYKKYAEFFALYLQKQLSHSDWKRILRMPNQDRPCVPYFNGTNGANTFNSAQTVILVGYPRLNPQDYLSNTYAAWGDSGFRKELTTMADQMEWSEHPWKDKLNSLPSVRHYETLHLAARLEQEIYRCAIRNPGCQDCIHVILFCPPHAVLKTLTERFPGCKVQSIKDLPSCVAYRKDTARSYNGKPTAYSRLAQYLSAWDGKPVLVADLRNHLEITPAMWKELMKQPRTKSLLQHSHVSRSGRGPHAALRRDIPF